MLTPEAPSVQPSFSQSIRVRITDQQLDLLENDQSVATYSVSTSKFGLGTEPGSFRTPLGRFEICEMIGAGSPPGAIFKGRRLTGSIACQGGDEDHILTRILRLAGCDSENANTRDRAIYIHGTNQENQIGSPASHGCIRMRNADIIELFDKIQPGTPVEILA